MTSHLVATPRWKFTTNLVMILIALIFFSAIAIDVEYHKSWGKNYLFYVAAFRSSTLDLVFRFSSFFGFEAFFIVLPILCWSGIPSLQILGSKIFPLFGIFWEQTFFIILFFV